MNNQDCPIRMAYPGRRTRKATKLSKVLLLVLLTFLSFIASVPFYPVNALLKGSGGGASNLSGNLGLQSPRSVGADPIPNLSMSKTILSNVDKLVGAGGITRTSQDNITIYNLAVAVRLLGGISPHDELLGPGRKTISSYSFWTVQSLSSGTWTSLLPVSNNFTFLGTNSTGTFLLRTMRVGQGCPGTMKIVYRATPAGPLKWDLGLVPCSSGHYRFEYSLQDMSHVYSPPGATKQYRVSSHSSNYTLSWNDVPLSFNVTSDIESGSLRLFIDLGDLVAGSPIDVDPSIVSTSKDSGATAYSFQRKTFYEPNGGYYFVFYYDGNNVGYRYSHEGNVWSSMQPMPSGWPYFDDPTSASDIYEVGQTILMATGTKGDSTASCTQTPCTSNLPIPAVSYSVGKIAGSNITWQPDSNGHILRTIATNVVCYSFSTKTCSMTFGTRYLSATIASNGFPAFSYNFWATGQNQGICTSGSSGAENDIWVTWSGGTSIVGCGYSPTHPLGSTILPSDSGSGVRVVFQIYENGSGRTSLSSWSSSGGLDSSGLGYMFGSSEFSASVDANYVTHVVYRGIPDGNITYAYQGQRSGGYSTNIFPGQAISPTISVDYSTGDLYVQAVEGQSIIMKRKPSGENWSDQTPVFPVTGRVNPTNLASSLSLASSTNSSRLVSVWTEGNGPYNVTFASIPILGIWSPYGLSADPWDGNGLSSHAQYFSNLGEHVSLSSGMLVVRQTDLSVAGRGLTLEITRVYDEPQSFFTTSPVGSEPYPWAPLGNGWQLDYPWMSNATNPPYIHLWNGEGYRIPSGFWTPGLPGWFENHQGDSFQLMSNSTGVFLYTVTGITYKFDSNNAHRLTMETDPLGNNITFSYNPSNTISSIRDTVGRTFLFCYSGGLVSRIEESGGSCGQETSLVRKISFLYSGSTLNVTDPANRVTMYQYQGTSGPAQWILSRVTYPSNWFTSYLYRAVTLGTQATTYRVLQQILSTSTGIPVRQFSYQFDQASGGDQITGSSLQAFNSTNLSGTWQLQLSSYTNYTFSFAGVGWNVSDASHGFLRGVEQRFGANGEQPREITLVSDGQGHLEGSYTNYYRDDLWGNRIYSRTSVNPSASSNHESFNAYYNNGLPPGFDAFQDTFSQNSGAASDNQWQTQSGYWMVQYGAYKGAGSPTRQESMLAWSDAGIGNMTIQASINVAEPLAGDNSRIGIFVHYSGSGANKWALVFHNRGGTTYLELLDDQQFIWLGDTQPFGKTLCPLNYNVWYTLTMTIQLGVASGQQVYAALGWVSAQGQQTCNGVMGNFPASSPVASATGFGLYAGGYSALFDNVIVSPAAVVGPLFTGSFIPTGAPMSTIKGALAGTAEYQNGTASATIESYNSYWPWGGLNQTKALYKSQSGNQWITTSRKYDSYGNPTSIVDARGNSTTLSYSSQYMSAYLTSRSQILKPSSTTLTTRYSYNFATGTLLSKVDPNGNNSTYQYDILGRVKRQSYPTGDYTNYTYNDVANYVDISNLNGWRTRQIYDGIDRLSITDRFLSGRSYSNETWTYNWMDKIVRNTDPLSNSYTYQYDALGRIAKTTKPDGNVTQVFYNDTAAWIRYTDETAKNFRCNYYDRLNRLISVVEYADKKCNAIMLSNYYFVTGYYYDEVGNLRKSITSDFNWLINPGFEYGNFTGWTQTNLVVNGFAHTGNYATKIFSTLLPFSISQNLSAPIPGIKITALGFWYYSGDPNGHDIVQVLYSDGSFSQTTLSQVVSWTWESPSFDKTKQVIGIKVSRSVTGIVPSLRLDDFVLRTSQTTLYSYDTLNRLTQTLYPDNATESYSYDFNSNLVSKTDRNGIVTTHLYDSLNRLTNTTYLSAIPTTESYSYDKSGNVLMTQNQNSTLTYIYDSWNRVTGEAYSVNGGMIGGPLCSTCGDGFAPVQNPQARIMPMNTPTPGGTTKSGYSFQYSYLGRVLQTMEFSDYRVFNYAYDGMGRLSNMTQIGTLTNKVLATFSYYKNDQVKSIQYGNGLVGNYTYNKLDRSSTITLKNGAATPLSLSYQYNNTGTVARVTGWSTSTSGSTISVNEQYRYDALQRLTNSTVTTGTATTTSWYEYDNLGNRLRQSLNGVVTSYTYNPTNNELTKSSSTGTSTAYTYDNSGQVITKNTNTTSATTHWTYTWNVPGNLLRASNDTGAQGIYAYDSLGRRVEAKEGSSTIFTAYAGTETLADQIAPGTAANDYLYANGILITNDGAYNSYPNYYTTDALGSVRLRTDENKNVVFSDNYQPFGQDNGTPTGSDSYKFTGKGYSSNTGLYYEFQRWYDPSIGRFISEDPLSGSGTEPQRLNPYVYASDFPTGLVDPSGLYASISGACPDYCGRESSVDFAMAAIIVLGSADVHLHLDSASFGGDFSMARISEPSRANAGSDGGDVAQEDGGNPTGEELSVTGGVRPIQIGKMGVSQGLSSLGVDLDQADLEVRTQTSLGGRVEDAYIKVGPNAGSIFEAKYSARGAPAPASEGNLLQARKDTGIVQSGGMVVNGQYLPVQRSIWYLPYGATPKLRLWLDFYGIQIHA